MCLPSFGSFRRRSLSLPAVVAPPSASPVGPRRSALRGAPSPPALASRPLGPSAASVPAAPPLPARGRRRASGGARLPALPSPPARPSAEVTPLSPDRYRVQVTIGGDTLEKLRLAKDLLRHASLRETKPPSWTAPSPPCSRTSRRGSSRRPRGPAPSAGTAPGSRHIPAEVKRAVWLRDLGRCAFVGTNGRRCTERGFLEFHHVHPTPLGGAATVGNIQLRCRAHNDYESRVCFGRRGGNGGDGLVREEAVPYGLPAAFRHSPPRGRELVPERVRRDGRLRSPDGSPGPPAPG